MRRRVPLLLLCLLLLLAAAHTAYWLWATHALADEFEQWAADRRAAGWTIAAGPPTRGGWPLRASLTLPEIAVRSRTVLPGGFSWGAERVTLETGLLAPDRLEVTPAGAQHVRLGDGPDVPFDAKRIVARFPLRDGVAPGSTDIRGDDVRFGLPSGSAPASRAVISLLQAHADWQAGTPPLTVALDATETTLPPGTRWPLGNRIAALSLNAALNGPVLPLASPREQAARWRDDGGALEVRRLSLGWGPLGLSGRATLTLDGQLQPAGTGTVRLVGYAEAADMLATNGALTRSAATTAKAVLALLAQLPEDGGAAEVDLPLTLRDRTLAMRQFPLLRLPPLTWPDRRP